jgi:hypothetical protein
MAHREKERAQGGEAAFKNAVAQSLLHRLFGDELQSILEERGALPVASAIRELIVSCHP